MLRSLIALATVMALTLVSGAEGADRRREAECRQITEKIRKLEARMRRPYSAAQGVRYDERLRELKEKRYRRCR